MTDEPGASAPLVEAIVEDPRWEAVGIGGLADMAARATLSELGLDPADHEISLLACDDARITSLNADFRGKPRPTNVLSWPSGELEGAGGGGAAAEPVFLGDIALAYETCAAEAAEAGLTLARHATHLVVHGVLHLLGHDHDVDAEAEEMERIEIKILAGMGVDNPYS